MPEHDKAMSEGLVRLETAIAKAEDALSEVRDAAMWVATANSARDGKGMRDLIERNLVGMGAETLEAVE